MNALLKENQSAVWCGNISSFVHPSLPGQVRLWSQVPKQHNFIFQGEGKCFAFLRLAVRWKGWVHSGKRFGGWERRYAQLEASQGALEACPDLACAWHPGGSKSLRILEGKKWGGWEMGEFYKKEEEGSVGRRGQASRKDHGYFHFCVCGGMFVFTFTRLWITDTHDVSFNQILQGRGCWVC